MSSKLRSMKEKKGVKDQGNTINVLEKFGRNMGRMEAFLEASSEVNSATPGISELVFDPEQRMKVLNALLALSLRIANKV